MQITTGFCANLSVSVSVLVSVSDSVNAPYCGNFHIVLHNSLVPGPGSTESEYTTTVASLFNQWV